MVPIHPLVVHFPIALLILAGVAYLYSVLMKKEAFWVLGLFMHMLGVVGAFIAFFTGNSAESELIHTESIHQMVELHELLGLLTIWTFPIMAVWSFLRRESTIIWEKGLFCLIYLGLAGMLSFNAHLGGRLVYEHGAGVNPMKPHLEKQFQQEQSQQKPIQ
jgi:uncharacterized membrane protein